ncbi:hypothetical protein BC943DRAFT_71122 [Umbelopsis sp. AD052]|nr:hypothetical protein BC943DRAFT_71122 [Umbelopsis sp. AD052]
MATHSSYFVNKTLYHVYTPCQENCYISIYLSKDDGPGCIEILRILSRSVCIDTSHMNLKWQLQQEDKQMIDSCKPCRRLNCISHMAESCQHDMSTKIYKSESFDFCLPTLFQKQQPNNSMNSHRQSLSSVSFSVHSILSDGQKDSIHHVHFSRVMIINGSDCFIVGDQACRQRTNCNLSKYT